LYENSSWALKAASAIIHGRTASVIYSGFLSSAILTFAARSFLEKGFCIK
jgi:hypothetical protein